LIKHDIKVIIVDGSKAGQCEVDCGMDWSSAEATDLAGQRVKARFGDRVQVEYLDLSQPVIDDHAVAVQQIISSAGLRPPLLIINNELRISGRFDIRMLMDAIEAEIEMKS